MDRFRLLCRWATGWGLIASLYAHTLFNANTTTITPIVAAFLGAIMLISAFLSLRRHQISRPATVLRQISLYLFASGLAFWVFFSIFHYMENPPNLRDIGYLGIYCGIPILILLDRDRVNTLHFTAKLCILMSIADLFFNILVIFHLAHPVNTAAYIANGLRHERYPGLSGGVLGGGEVALIAATYTAWQIKINKRNNANLYWIATLIIIFFDLLLIDARRDTVAALIAIFIILVPVAHVVPLPIYAFFESAFGIFITFVVQAGDVEQQQRQALMLAGLSDIKDVFWTGNGPYYHSAQTEGIDFTSLWLSHSTESGFIDICLTFGVPATLVIFSSIIICLIAERAYVSWIPALLAVITGEFAYNNQSGFLGSYVFFGCIICVIFHEVSPAQHRLNRKLGMPRVAMVPG